MPQQVTFTDPAGVVPAYVWPVNPNPDAVTQYAQKQRQIDRTSNTGNVGATKQQGDDGSYIIHWEPNIYHEAHEQAMWQWWMLCKLQTIYLTDFDGETFEGQIITLGREQKGVLSGPGDAKSRMFYCTYVFEFEVYRFVSGLMAAAGTDA